LNSAERAVIRVLTVIASIIIAYPVALWVNGVLLNANVSTQNAGYGEVLSFFGIVLICNGLIYVTIKR